MRTPNPKNCLEHNSILLFFVCLCVCLFVFCFFPKVDGASRWYFHYIFEVNRINDLIFY
jgi:cell division protein FtsW (lipid II flippase)